MKKIVFGSLLVASSLLAVDIKPYVGLSLGGINTNLESNFVDNIIFDPASGSLDESSTDFAFIISGGAILNEAHRVSISYTNSKLKYDGNDDVQGGDTDFYMVLANYDYLFKLDSFTPYIGASIGYADVKELDDEGFAYGINLGVIKDINENISLELGYKYTYFKETFEQTIIRPVGTGNLTEKTEITGSHYIGFGINYKF